MIVDRCDRPSLYTKRLTQSAKNPTGVKDGSGCKVQQHYLHRQSIFFLNVHDLSITGFVTRITLWLQLVVQVLLNHYRTPEALSDFWWVPVNPSSFFA
jgi:hypothetical protein